MLSDSPPDRDIIWTEDGVAGAHRFVQRVWRIVSEWVETRKSLGGAAGAIPNSESAPALALRKTTHRALASAEENIAGFRFNVAVAKIYELVNAIGTATGSAANGDGTLRAAIDEALGHLAVMIAPMMPHLAEECWAALGHAGLAASAPWPAVDRALLTEDTVTLPVQINGKKRDELTIAAGASQADIEKATLALDTVRRALDGQKPKKIVVVPKRIVNVVV
jgi:leucyl-tRNA synthetase